MTQIVNFVTTTPLVSFTGKVKVKNTSMNVGNIWVDTLKF